MKIAVKIIVTLLVLQSCSAYDEKKVSQLIQEGEIEVIGNTFSVFSGSEEIIDKYRLTNEEIAIVGIWGNSTLNKYEITNENSGMGQIVSFLPSKIFISEKTIQLKNTDGTLRDETIENVIGRWKILNNELLVKPEKIVTISGKSHAKVEDTYREEKTDYYPIWKMAMHTSGALQLNSFYFNFMPDSVRKFYDISLLDFIRVRAAIPLMFGNGDNSFFQKEKPWHAFLLSDNIDDKQYLSNLRNMIRFYGYDYDFAENEYGLIF